MRGIVERLINRIVKQRLIGSLFLYRLARRIVIAFENRDVDIATNGEHWLQQRVVEEGEVVAFDVGANRGEWANGMILVAPCCRIYCFEPIPATFEVLRKAISEPNVTHVQVALSDAPGELLIQAVPDRPELASAHANYADEFTITSMTIPAATGDAEMERFGLEKIHILKVDAEGHDFAVLKGFDKAIHSEKIDVIQFEYNYATLAASRSLRDFFQLLESHYLVCKLLPSGLEAYGYHPSLDNFAQSNWVAVRLAAVDSSLGRCLNIRPVQGLGRKELLRSLRYWPEVIKQLGLAH